MAIENLPCIRCGGGSFLLQMHGLSASHHYSNILIIQIFTVIQHLTFKVFLQTIEPGRFFDGISVSGQRGKRTELSRPVMDGHPGMFPGFRVRQMDNICVFI